MTNHPLTFITFAAQNFAVDESIRSNKKCFNFCLL